MTEKKETNLGEKMEEGTSTQTIDLSNRTQIFDFIRNTDDEDLIKKGISDYLKKLTKGLERDYQIVFLFDDYSSISHFHSNRIYDVCSSAHGKDIFLILHSKGGKIEPAYLASKTCKQLAKKRFIVGVPRRAKSAATLLCLGADEIHMGLMSELGPIDPQIEGYPVLGLANALEVLANLTNKHPESAKMFAFYLTSKLDLKDLGYFERVGESASQYAERLLNGKSFDNGQTPQKLAIHFVNHYKDHGFVIDADEARSLLGDNMIKLNTAEYKCANEIFNFLNFLDICFSVIKQKEMSYVGDIDNGLILREQKN